MKKPELSKDFNIDDLYKLREYNSLRHIAMTTEEINAELQPSVDEFNRLIEEKREKNKVFV